MVDAIDFLGILSEEDVELSLADEFSSVFKQEDGSSLRIFKISK